MPHEQLNLLRSERDIARNENRSFLPRPEKFHSVGRTNFDQCPIRSASGDTGAFLLTSKQHARREATSHLLQGVLVLVLKLFAVVNLIGGLVATAAGLFGAGFPLLPVAGITVAVLSMAVLRLASALNWDSGWHFRTAGRFRRAGRG